MKCCIALIASLLLFSCNQDDPYKKLNKLSGTWIYDDNEGGLYEEWSKSSNDKMYGKTYKINGSDSIVFERVELRKDKESIFYLPVVKDQNGSKAVPFRLISSAEDAFTFENKDHDFPQRIIYRFVNNDSIVARIEGDVKGELKFVEYFYRRAQ